MKNEVTGISKFFDEEGARVTIHVVEGEMNWGDGIDSMGNVAPSFSFHGPTYITCSPFSGCEGVIHFFADTSMERGSKKIGDEYVGKGLIPNSIGRYSQVILSVLYKESEISHLLSYFNIATASEAEVEIRADCVPNPDHDGEFLVTQYWTQVRFRRSNNQEKEIRAKVLAELARTKIE